MKRLAINKISGISADFERPDFEVANTQNNDPGSRYQSTRATGRLDITVSGSADMVGIAYTNATRIRVYADRDEGALLLPNDGYLLLPNYGVLLLPSAPPVGALMADLVAITNYYELTTGNVARRDIALLDYSGHAIGTHHIVVELENEATRCSGTAGSPQAGKLVDPEADFITAGVRVADYARNITSDEWTLVTAIDDGQHLSLEQDIFIEGGEYIIGEPVYSGVVHAGPAERYSNVVYGVSDTDRLISDSLEYADGYLEEIVYAPPGRVVAGSVPVRRNNDYWRFKANDRKCGLGYRFWQLVDDSGSDFVMFARYEDNLPSGTHNTSIVTDVSFRLIEA